MLHESFAAMSQTPLQNGSVLAHDERTLAAAFASFTEVASSLERSYTGLQQEVGRLRRELEVANGELVESLEENRRSRCHLDQLLEVLPCGVLELTAEGRVLLSNPEARRLLEAFEILPPAIRALMEDCGRRGGELEWSGDPAPARWLAIHRSVLQSPQEPRQIFILQDISRLKRLQQEHEMLRRKQALAELSAVLAHEVRNPLASMELFAGLLVSSGLSPEQQSCVEHLRAGLRMLGATVNNVLEFHSEAKPQFVPTELGEFLRCLQDFLQPLLQQSGIGLTLRHSLDGISIPADRHRLQQVFLNLALNSVRHLPQGGQLVITGELRQRSDETWACIEVSDNGPGIAPEHLAKIFEPGFTTRPGSPGLGLSVCRTLLEQHGARITVVSPPQGVTFCLELPGARP
jgi:signal transduction histidine kinase